MFFVAIALCKDGWCTSKKMKEEKKSSKTIDMVSYALKVSVNGVMCLLILWVVANILHKYLASMFT